MPNRYGNRANALVFSCKCGKQLFGVQIDEEVERQQKAYSPSSDGSGQGETLVARRQREREEEGRAIQERLRLRDERTRRERERQEAYMEANRPVPASVLPSCAWKDCTHSPRETSKYCSKECSNKNARWRHRQRMSA